MKIFKVYYEASVGACYIKARNLDSALNKLSSSTFGQDTKDVRFDSWEPELFDVDRDGIEELEGEDEKEARKVMFEEKPEDIDALAYQDKPDPEELPWPSRTSSAPSIA